MFTRNSYKMAKALFIIGAILMGVAVIVLGNGDPQSFGYLFIGGALLVLSGIFIGLIAEISLAVGGHRHDAAQ